MYGGKVQITMCIVQVEEYMFRNVTDLRHYSYVYIFKNLDDKQSIHPSNSIAMKCYIYLSVNGSENIYKYLLQFSHFYTILISNLSAGTKQNIIGRQLK